MGLSAFGGTVDLESSVEIESFSLSTDEGSAWWTAEITLLDLAAFRTLRNGDPIALEVAGEIYELIVYQKTVSRENPADLGLQLTAKSPAIKLTSPMIVPMTKTWETAALASVIAQEICDLADLALDWRLMDWAVPANVLTITAADPLQVIQSLAEAAGGTVESGIDGTVIVRPLFPDSPANYADDSIVAYVLTDEQDNLSVTEPLASSVFYDYVEVGNEEPSVIGGDRIEYIADEGSQTSGVLRVYPYPWRTNFTLESTGPATVLLTLLGERIGTEEETVTIAAYEGSVAYPVYATLSTEWVARDLGDVSIPQYLSDITVDGTDLYGYSMLRISYQKRYIEYGVQGRIGDISNIIMLETV